MVKLGFVLSSEQFPATDLIEYGVQAEQAGFDAVWSSDHFQPWQANEGHSSMAWVTLAAVGQRTSRILLGTGVTCPSFRYRPAIVAEAFATLGLLYPGRVFLGVGAGEALNEVAAGAGWGSYRERANRLLDAVELIRKLWSGQQISHESKYSRIESARLYDVPDRPVPIYVAAGGPRSAELAGKCGDGLITDAKRALEPRMREAFARGADSNGNHAGPKALVTEAMAVVGGVEEAKRGAELWRFMPKSWERYVADPDPRSIERRAKAEIPLEQVYGDWTIGTDPETHARSILKLVEAGVTHVFVHSPQSDQSSVIDFYGREVLPRVRRVEAGAAARQ